MGDDAFLKKVKKTLERHAMIRQGDRVLCAVSGGADSVALLRAMRALSPYYGFSVAACHMEHGIRGLESREDMRFVQELCQELSVRLLVETADVPSLARQNRVGLETAAREARHEFYRRAADALGCRTIAVGHHLDDQAETTLMQLSRGTHGAMGIRPAADGKIRPLIEIPNAQILAWLDTNGWQYRKDATNLVADNPRNAIRHRVLPELALWYPGAAEAIGRAAEFARSDDDFLQSLASDWLKGTGGIPGPPWPAEPVLRRGLVLYVAECGAGAVLSAALLNRLITLALEGRTGQRICYGEWLWERGKDGSLYLVENTIWGEELALPIPGEAETPYGRFIAKVTGSWDGPLPDGTARQLFDADKLPPLIARTRRPGDRMRPLGSAGSRKLKGILLDRGIPRARRDALPLLAHQNQVYWLPGLPPEEAAKVTENTRRYALIEYEEEVR